MLSRRVSAGISLACVVFAAGVFSTHRFESLWPWLPIGTGGAICCLVVSAFIERSLTQRDAIGYIGVAVGLSLLARLTAYFHPASLIGNDPDAFAVQSQIVIQTGSLKPLVLDFYSIAAGFQVFTAETGLLTGTNAVLGNLSTLLALGTLAVLIPVTVSRRMTSGNTWEIVVIAAALGVVATSNFRHSVSLRGHSLSVAIWGVMLLIIAIHRKFDGRWLLVSGVLIVGLIFTHKLQLLLLSAVIAAILVGPYIEDLLISPVGLIRSNASRYRLISWNFGLLIVALIVLQWVFVTGFLDSVVLLAIAALEQGIREGGGVAIAIRAGVTPVRGLATIFTGWSYVTTLLAVGGVAWAIVWWKNTKDVTRRVLYGTAILVTFLVGSLVAPGLGGIKRYMMVTTPYLIPVIAVGLGGSYLAVRSRERTRPYSAIVQPLIVAAIIIVVAGQVAPPLWSPDHPSQPRAYLTADEITAKEWAHTNVEGVFWADHYYQDEASDIERAAASGNEYYQYGVPRGPGMLQEELWNATLVEKERSPVLYRKDVGWLRLTDMFVNLTWNPEAVMDGRYHQVYSNGDVTMHARPHTNTTRGGPAVTSSTNAGPGRKFADYLERVLI